MQESLIIEVTPNYRLKKLLAVYLNLSLSNPGWVEKFILPNASIPPSVYTDAWIRTGSYKF